MFRQISPQKTASRRQVIRLGTMDALGLPGLVLGASFLGFGSLVRESGLSIWGGAVSTLTTWALPGQIVMLELWAVGSSLTAIGLAVWLTNARLMPMVVSLLPLVREGGGMRWRHFLAAQLIAVTAWSGAMRRCPELPRAHRLVYLYAFGGTLVAVTFATTLVGFAVAGGMPASVTLGLVFLNPIYFMLVMVTDLRYWARALSLGAVLGPLVYLATPDWGLLLAGVGAGSLAFLVDRWLGVRHG